MKVEEGNGIDADEGGLSPMVDGASPGPGSVLKYGLTEKVAEPAAGAPDEAADKKGTTGSAEMVSAEGSITVLKCGVLSGTDTESLGSGKEVKPADPAKERSMRVRERFPLKLQHTAKTKADTHVFREEVISVLEYFKT